MFFVPPCVLSPTASAYGRDACHLLAFRTLPPPPPPPPIRSAESFHSCRPPVDVFRQQTGLYSDMFYGRYIHISVYIQNNRPLHRRSQALSQLTRVRGLVEKVLTRGDTHPPTLLRRMCADTCIAPVTRIFTIGQEAGAAHWKKRAAENVQYLLVIGACSTWDRGLVRSGDGCMEPLVTRAKYQTQVQSTALLQRLDIGRRAYTICYRYLNGLQILAKGKPLQNSLIIEKRIGAYTLQKSEV